MAILTDVHCNVETSGEAVILSFGPDCLFSLDHETAQDIATDLRIMAIQAKKAAGDRSRTWSAFGAIHDANGALPPTILTGPMQKRGDYDVGFFGGLLSLRISRVTAKMGYQDALQVAGWLRTQAKRAARVAGDRRHWADISSVDNATDKAIDVVGSCAPFWRT